MLPSLRSDLRFLLVIGSTLDTSVGGGAIAVLVESVQRGGLKTLAAENYGLEPVRSNGANLIVHVSSGRDGENVVEFCQEMISKQFVPTDVDVEDWRFEHTFKRSLLGLWQPEEDHDKCHEVHGSIEAESTD